MSDIQNFRNFLNENENESGDNEKLFKTRYYEEYTISPHLIGDTTGKVLFLIFENDALVMDVSYNNGGHRLWMGRMKDYLRWEDNKDLFKYVDDWAKTIYAQEDVYGFTKEFQTYKNDNRGRFIGKKFGL
jgi:hypothetical protein